MVSNWKVLEPKQIVTRKVFSVVPLLGYETMRCESYEAYAVAGAQPFLLVSGE
jgi:hypothetical protein